MNPGNEKKAKRFQQRLNHVSELIGQASDEELIGLLKKGAPKETGRKKKVLVVEDEFGLQETFRDIFSLEGYDVRVAVDGKDGYKTFLEFKPDLVFTDVVMPKMTGIELVRKIHQDHPAIKVIYISGFFGLRNMKRDLNDDVLKYGYPCLSKPFKIRLMLELVEEYLHSPI
jgi:YesN/AraC family two-component response regulator